MVDPGRTRSARPGSTVAGVRRTGPLQPARTAWTPLLQVLICFPRASLRSVKLPPPSTIKASREPGTRGSQGLLSCCCCSGCCYSGCCCCSWKSSGDGGRTCQRWRRGFPRLRANRNLHVGATNSAGATSPNRTACVGARDWPLRAPAGAARPPAPERSGGAAPARRDPTRLATDPAGRVRHVSCRAPGRRTSRPRARSARARSTREPSNASRRSTG